MWKRRIVHLLVYMFSILLIILTWLSGDGAIDKIFKTGIVLYLSIIYIEFFDGSLLEKFKLSNFFEKQADYHEISDINQLINASKTTIHYINLIHQYDGELRNHYIAELRMHYESIKNIQPSNRTKKDYENLLKDTKEILGTYEDDVEVVQ